MADSLLLEKAKAFSALSRFYSGDDKTAWSLLENIDADYSLPFASYAKCVAHSDGDEERFNEILRDVRSAFERTRIPFSVIPYSSDSSDVHFLYLAGNEEIIEGRKLVFLGSVMPSLQGRKDTAEAVMEAVKKGYTITAPFDSGLGPYALSVALKEGGKVCAVLSNELSLCPNENLLKLMEGVYKNGLLLSQFPPSTKREKWHVVLRNRFLSSFGDAFFLAEEKDGGPGWAVFDQALKNGKKCGISSKCIANPVFSFAYERYRNGALEIKKPRDINLLFVSSSTRRKKSVNP